MRYIQYCNIYKQEGYFLSVNIGYRSIMIPRWLVSSVSCMKTDDEVLRCIFFLSFMFICLCVAFRAAAAMVNWIVVSWDGLCWQLDCHLTRDYSCSSNCIRPGSASCWTQTSTWSCWWAECCWCAGCWCACLALLLVAQSCWRTAPGYFITSYYMSRFEFISLFFKSIY